MKVRKGVEKEYQKLIEVNSYDSFGKTTLAFMTEWAELIELKIQNKQDVATAAEEALGDRIDTADGKIAALEATVDTKTTGLKDRMTAAEADIDSLKSDMTAAQGDITNINTDITNIQAQLANLIPLTNAELDAMLEEVYR